jgi:RNA-binding protein YlmH
MDAEELMKNRMKELADKAYQQSVYCHTSFLGLPEQSLYYQIEKELSYAHASLDGGYEDAERKVLIFGSQELFGYEGISPVRCLKISPISLKFSEMLNHRDYLGAILNLGIERECLGDILVDESGAYLFCMDHMSEFLCEHITKIRHTLVNVQEVDEREIMIRPKLKPMEGFLASFRLDAVISLGFGLSRKESSDFIKNKRVFLNGRLVENAGKQVSEGDTISVRGKGKMKFTQIRGQSKKGRFSVLMHLYI